MLDLLSPTLTTTRPRVLQLLSWTEPTKPIKGTMASVTDQQFELELCTQRTIGADETITPKTKAKRRSVARASADEPAVANDTRFR